MHRHVSESWPITSSCAEAPSAGVRAEQDHVMGHNTPPLPPPPTHTPALTKYQESESLGRASATPRATQSMEFSRPEHWSG